AVKACAHLGVFDGDIFQIDIFQPFFRQADKGNPRGYTVHFYVADKNIAHRRRGAHGLGAGVEGVDVNGLVGDVLHLDVAHINILDGIAATALGLEANAAVGAVKEAVVHIDIA